VRHGELKRSITTRQLYFYVVGDVLGSGIYVLVGLVAAAVGGAFWMAFLAGVAIATITGLAYAELVTRLPGHQQGLSQSGAHVLHHHLHAVGQ
jgi:amino acid transporter